MTILFLKSELHQKMWGGQNLADYGFNLESDHVGEAWVVAAHQNGDSHVMNGKLSGMPLAEVWQQHPELFGGHDENEAFPLLVKILDAQKNLSIQVHPNDDQARKVGENFGKTESWYILSAEPDAKLYYGHRAKNKTALRQAVNDKDWDNILRTIPVKAGDFFYVPSGTFHALGAGIVAMEIQQSSDTTYRFYDFDRVDPTTHQLRALQVDEALAVTKAPHIDPILGQRIMMQDNTIITRLLMAPYFSIDKLSIRGRTVLNQHHNYELFTVISGKGTLTIGHEHYDLQKGMSFILAKDVNSYVVDGDMTLIKSFVTPKIYRNNDLAFLKN